MNRKITETKTNETTMNAQNTIEVIYREGIDRVEISYLMYNLNPVFAPVYTPVMCYPEDVDAMIAKYAHTRSKIGCDGNYEVTKTYIPRASWEGY